MVTIDKKAIKGLPQMKSQVDIEKRCGNYKRDKRFKFDKSIIPLPLSLIALVLSLIKILL